MREAIACLNRTLLVLAKATNKVLELPRSTERAEVYGPLCNAARSIIFARDTLERKEEETGKKP